MTTLLTMVLQEARDLPIRERIDAEVRFARELERRPGVVTTLLLVVVQRLTLVDDVHSEHLQ
jgi:hypothetical protein